MDYWYQPKGLALSVESILPRLRVLKEFEHGKPWRECQKYYVERLREDGISGAEATWEEGGAPLARMLKQPLAVTGLVWVDDREKVDLTPTGNYLLECDDPSSVLAHQALKYQFYNPIVRKSSFSAVQLHPVPFLVRLLQALGKPINSIEYRLFVAKAKAIKDVDRVAEQIDEFRRLDEEERNAIISKCERYNIGGDRRKSIYNTIKLAQSYAWSMWTLSDLIQRNDDELSLVPGSLRKDNRAFMDKYNVEGEYITFINKKEFVAWMGDREKYPFRETALEIYQARNDLEAATQIQRKRGMPPSDIKRFRQEMVDEKQLEDVLEANFDNIGKFLKTSIKLVGRQYPTTVGPIDLLGQKNDGTYVVIELKKGRSADKVFGQLSRYMGWIKRNLADGADVHGIIVAAKIDDKLKSAREAHTTKVDLIEYQSGMTMQSV